MRLPVLDDLETRGCEPIDVSEGLTFFWLAWQALSSKRSRGMSGPDPIDYSEIESWLDAQGARGELRELTHRTLMQMDLFYLNWVAKKLNAK